MSRCHGNHRQNTRCSFSSSFTRFCSVRPSHNCFSLVKEKVGSVKPLFPLVGPNRHLFRLGPRTKMRLKFFEVDQRLEMLRVALVTILAREMRSLKFFEVDQRLEMLRVALVTILAREMRLKYFQVDQALEMLRVALVTILAREMRLKSTKLWRCCECR